MRENRANSFAEFHDLLTPYRNDMAWVFRGHSRIDWGLVPKAGRLPYSAFNDLEMFEHWKRRAVEYTSIQPRDDWDWLAIAQHHGFATRLLDWTSNPLVAAFFAVQETDLKQDAVVYAYHSDRVVITEEIAPHKFDGIVRFRPRGVAARIVRQDGLFTVHGPAALSLVDNLHPDEQLERIVIAAPYRKNLLHELFQFGVSLLSLFPDLDGLSNHINWYMRNADYYRSAQLEKSTLAPTSGNPRTASRTSRRR
jgi:hypothetical protein